MDQTIFGYTVVNSLNAILQLSAEEFNRIYGWSTERALIFTSVSTGKSPMVAIRVTAFKPRCVILQGIDAENVHPFVIKMADRDHITVLCTEMDINKIVSTPEGERMVGIITYGAYIPRYRIKVEEITRVWGANAADITGGLGVFEKSVPDLDEDAATIAVEAARNALKRRNIDPEQ